MNFRADTSSLISASESPIVFSYSEKMKTVRRNGLVLLLGPPALELMTSYLGAKPPVYFYYFLIPSLMIGGLFMWFQGRGAAAEVFHDHARLPSRWPPYKLIPVRFSEINRIEKVPKLLLTIVYGTAGTKHKVFVSIQYLADAAGLEALLVQSTGLKVEAGSAWWNAPEWTKSFTDDSDLADRRFLWKHFIVRPLQWLVIILINAALMLVIMLVLFSLRKQPPEWVFAALPILTLAGSYYLWWRWQRRRKETTPAPKPGDAT